MKMHCKARSGMAFGQTIIDADAYQNLGARNMAELEAVELLRKITDGPFTIEWSQLKEPGV